MMIKEAEPKSKFNLYNYEVYALVKIKGVVFSENKEKAIEQIKATNGQGWESNVEEILELYDITEIEEER